MLNLGPAVRFLLLTAGVYNAVLGVRALDHGIMFGLVNICFSLAMLGFYSFSTTMYEDGNYQEED